MRLLFLSLLILAQSLFGQGYSDTPEIEEKELYLSYDSVPKKIYLSQQFDITIKALSTQKHFVDIEYTFKEAKGVKLLNSKPKREIKGRYFYDTFSFVAQKHYMQLPTIEAVIRYSPYHTSKSYMLEALNLESISLHQNREYAHIICESFFIQNYKTTRYSPSKIITLFSAQAKGCDLSHFAIDGIAKQGFESLSSDENGSIMTYYIVLDDRVENFEFTYFDPTSERYEKVLIPIIIEDDSVSTQSDLAPQESNHKRIKIAIAAGFMGLFILLFFLRGSKFYLLFATIALIITIANSMSIETRCVKKGAHIHILPMQNSTLFDITTKEQTLEVLGSRGDYTKIKLNNTTGWINSEDLCNH